MRNTIFIIILGLSLISCNTGGSNNNQSSQLTAFPPSGSYSGTATPANTSGVSYGVSGSVSDQTGTFNIDAESGVIMVSGTFQLNNDTCFTGTETFQQESTSFVGTQCSFKDNNLTMQYQDGLNNTGSINVAHF